MDNDILFYGLIIGAVIITIFYFVMLLIYKSVASFKEKYWKGQTDLAILFNLKIKEDESNIFKWPIVFGYYEDRIVLVKTYELRDNNKNGMYIQHKAKIPNTIWILNSKIENNPEIKKLEKGFKEKKINKDLIVRYNNTELTKTIFKNEKVKEMVNVLNRKNNLQSLLITPKYVQYYNIKWKTSAQAVIKIFNELIEFVKTLENVLKDNPSNKKVPISRTEKLIEKRTEKALKLKNNLKDIGILIGAPCLLPGILLVIVVSLFFVYDLMINYDFQVVIILGSALWLFGMFIVIGLTIYYFWWKYKFTLYPLLF